MADAAASDAAAAASRPSSIIWFRKGLRLHDNPALHAACQPISAVVDAAAATKPTTAAAAGHVPQQKRQKQQQQKQQQQEEQKDPALPPASLVYPIFVLDPWFLRPDAAAPSPGSTRVGVNRILFLLQSLADLDLRLRQLGSRLVVLEGDPMEVLPGVMRKLNVQRLCFESDTEPYAIERDGRITEIAKSLGVEVVSPVSHTIYDPAAIIKKNGGKPPLTYQSFCKLIGQPAKPVGPPPPTLPAVPDAALEAIGARDVPSLESLGYEPPEESLSSPFVGGETEGLRRLEEMMKRTKWVADFEKPKGDPTAFLQPATTVLSPYLKFGCVSSRLMLQSIHAVYAKHKSHSKPPVSLEGQLIWREFFYCVAYGTPHFDQMQGSSICKQIPWKRDEELLAAWRDGRTGFPWIDAAMIQLRTWGWMHHLARHAVACFLTRGDLFVHWELGRDVFDRLLLDADWSINNGNWLWLSASAFFAQYHRIYSPNTFGKKYDPEGKYVRHFIPALKDMPSKYIYEPWTAPKAVQERAKCIIGKDYPFPVVDHAEESKKCKERMAAAYALNKGGQPTLDELEEAKEQLDVKLEGKGQSKVKPTKEAKRQRLMTDY